MHKQYHVAGVTLSSWPAPLKWRTTYPIVGPACHRHVVCHGLMPVKKWFDGFGQRDRRSNQSEQNFFRMVPYRPSRSKDPEAETLWVATISGSILLHQIFSLPTIAEAMAQVQEKNMEGGPRLLKSVLNILRTLIRLRHKLVETSCTIRFRHIIRTKDYIAGIQQPNGPLRRRRPLSARPTCTC